MSSVTLPVEPGFKSLRGCFETASKMTITCLVAPRGAYRGIQTAMMHFTDLMDN